MVSVVTSRPTDMGSVVRLLLPSTTASCDFRRCVNAILVVLGCYVAQSGG
jgi:hypothetical protein